MSAEVVPPTDEEAGVRDDTWKAAIRQGRRRGWLKRSGKLITATEAGIAQAGELLPGRTIDNPATILLTAIVAWGAETTNANQLDDAQRGRLVYELMPAPYG